MVYYKWSKVVYFEIDQSMGKIDHFYLHDIYAHHNFVAN